MILFRRDIDRAKAYVAAPSGIACALLSATRQRAEEWVTDDWAAVAAAVNQRMTELGRRQREVIKRSRLSKQTVGEIQNNSEQRKRSPNTLERLSVALNWHPDHLAAVLAGRTPPEAGKSYARSKDDLPGRLAVLEEQVALMRQELQEIKESGTMMDDHFVELRNEVITGMRQIIIRLRQSGG